MCAGRFIRVCEAAGVASARSRFTPDETRQYAIMKQRMIAAVTMKLIDCKATTGPVVEWLAGSGITGALQIFGEHVSLMITAVCFSGGDDDFDPDGGLDKAYDAPQNRAAFLLRRYERKWLLEQVDGDPVFHPSDDEPTNKGITLGIGLATKFPTKKGQTYSSGDEVYRRIWFLIASARADSPRNPSYGSGNSGGSSFLSKEGLLHLPIIAVSTTPPRVASPRPTFDLCRFASRQSSN